MLRKIANRILSAYKLLRQPHGLVEETKLIAKARKPLRTESEIEAVIRQAILEGEFDGLRRRSVGSSHADRAAVHESGSENGKKTGGSLEDKFNQTIKNAGFAPAWIIMNKDIRSDMHKWRRALVIAASLLRKRQIHSNPIPEKEIRFTGAHTAAIEAGHRRVAAIIDLCHSQNNAQPQRASSEELPNAGGGEGPEPLSVENGDNVWTDHLYLLHQRLSRINSRLRHYNLIAPVHLQVIPYRLDRELSRLSRVEATNSRILTNLALPNSVSMERVLGEAGAADGHRPSATRDSHHQQDADGDARIALRRKALERALQGYQRMIRDSQNPNLAV